MDEYKPLATETEEEKLNRLRRLEAVLDPVTTRHLEMIGVTDGWKCLEIGAGAGSVAQWLSKRVGPKGKVVATDIDTRLLRQLNIPNLEIRQHDIVNDDLEEDEYHLAHCRSVLTALKEPEQALQKMAAAVRPGGWLIIEEDDYGSILSTDLTNPAAAPFVAAWRGGIDRLRKMRILDPLIGRQVRSFVEQLGFADVSHEGLTHVNRGGDAMAQFDAATMQMTGKPAIAAGLLTQEQFDSIIRLLQDPTFYYLGLTMFSAWGRKPE
jgi:ubiquinone/menaquinone biosynthesis C-methylase UbiE